MSAVQSMEADWRAIISKMRPGKHTNWDIITRSIATTRDKGVQSILSILQDLKSTSKTTSAPSEAQNDEIITFRHKILERACLKIIHQEFDICFGGMVSLGKGVVSAILDRLDWHYEGNVKYDILTLKNNVFGEVIGKHRKFINRYDKDKHLIRYFETLSMECIALCEDFKSLWMEFYSSDGFFDYIDVGIYDFVRFNEIVCLQAESRLEQYDHLKTLVKSDIFAECWQTYTEFSSKLGKFIFSYFKKIGKNTMNALKKLDAGLKSAKFLTNLLVVLCVSRLRYKLKSENSKNFHNTSYLMNVSLPTLHKFFKCAVLNFDKDLSPYTPPAHLVRAVCTGIGMVHRDSDNTLGILVHTDSGERYILHRDKYRQVHTIQADRISNRWKVIVHRIESIQGYTGQTVGQILLYTQGERIWSSIDREVMETGVDRVSMSPLGRLMEDLIFTSKSLRECLRTFGKNSSSEGMLTFMVMQIPLVGGTIYTVMEFYGLGKILRSDYISRDDKLDEIAKKVTKVGFTFGAVFTSSLVGQMVIPVPVLGALVGGLVGGIFSTLFGQAVDRTCPYPSILYSQCVQRIVRARRANGLWGWGEEIEGIRHILARWHTLTLPKGVEAEVWLSVICLVSISLWAEGGGEEIDSEWTDTSIQALSERIDVLDYPSECRGIMDTLGVLCKEGYIQMDKEILDRQKRQREDRDR